ncbi:MAG TPA: hypothetical protein VFT04_09675 [Gemmatimonadales bacterium]|nr:hypothetical protein [Gemmatimonadales bacterium]
MGATLWSRTRCIHGLIPVIAIGAAACGDGPVEPLPGGGEVLVIAPSALLLAEPGASHAIKVYRVDADGDSTLVDATFQSSDPSVVSIAQGGIATGGTALGSAQIIATSGELISAPILVLRATPAAGALLVADSQVVGGVEAVDPAATYGPGWRYRVRLRGVNPAVGQVVLATGGAPIGGRVASVGTAGADTDVVLEQLTLDEMFESLSVRQQLSLAHARVEIPDELRQSFRISKTRDGGLRLTPRDGRGTVRAAAARPAPGMAAVEQEFQIGSFTCKAEVPPLFTFPLSLDIVSLELDHTLSLDLVIENAAVERVVVEGGIAPRLSAKPLLTAALEAKAECKDELAVFILPIGGALSTVVGGQVPAGIGFEIGAKASFGQLGFDAFLQAAVSAEFGIDCAGGCRIITDIGGEAPDGYFKPVLPDLNSDVRFELSASAFAWAELSLGSPLLESLRFKTVELKAGLEQKMDLATRATQADDPAYASNYSLKPVLEAKAAATLTPIANLLRINLATLTFAPELPTLAQSPRGTLAITPATVAAGSGAALGEQATFTVTLTDVGYLGAYAVEGIEIRWRRTSGTTVTLEPGRPGCTDLSATQDQLTFTCATDFLAEHAGAQTFYAFIRTRIFGVPVPVPLEVSPDGKATVTVTGGAVSVTPSTVTLSPGETQEFSAAVAGGGAQAVTWSATGGTFTVSGNSILYTAGDTPGSYSVTATSVAAPAFSASAAITIAASAGGSATLVNVGGFAQSFVQFPGSTPCNDIDESSEQEAFSASRTFTSQCAGTWTSPPTDVPATLSASASGNVTYQLSLDGNALRSVTAGGNATATASGQGQPNVILGGKGETHSADVWFDFEVQGTVTVTLSGQVSSSSSTTFESPRAFVSLDRHSSGTIYFAEQGGVGTTLTLAPGRYTLRGDAFADASVSLPDRTSGNSSASFSVTMTVNP